jgi:photosystem II P680 reaction center D1 protein
MSVDARISVSLERRVSNGSLVTSTLVRKTDDNESINCGYKFGQKQQTYNFWANENFLGRLLFQGRGTGQTPVQTEYRSKHRGIHLLLASWPVTCIWCAALGIGCMGFNLNGFNFNQSIKDSQGRVIPTWADSIEWANIGIAATGEMLYNSTQNLPAELIAGEPVPVNSFEF